MGTGDDTLFWAGAVERELVVQRCESCGVLRHPPTPMCAACGAVGVVGATLSGCGRVLSWIFSHHPNAPDEPPRVVVLVELAEGLRVVSNLVDPLPAMGYNDLDVIVDFMEVGSAIVPVFRASGGRDQR